MGWGLSLDTSDVATPPTFTGAFKVVVTDGQTTTYVVVDDAAASLTSVAGLLLAGLALAAF